jgi:uncharacterized protein (DUF1778 family)
MKPRKRRVNASTAAAPSYLDLKADERQELRLPALLKDHIAQVAAQQGESVSEYMLRVLAADVSVQIVKPVEWHLSAPEFMVLLDLLLNPPPETKYMAAARARAKKIFGASSTVR